MEKEKKIIGFSVDTYTRHDTDNLLINDNTKNIIPLEKMTPKQRYELALGDDEDAIVYDNLDSFLVDLNDGIINAEGYFFYQYEPQNMPDSIETPSESEIEAYTGFFTEQTIFANINELDEILGKHKTYSIPHNLSKVQFTWFAKYKNKIYEIYNDEYSERVGRNYVIEFHIGTNTKNSTSDSEVKEFTAVLKEQVEQLIKTRY